MAFGNRRNDKGRTLILGGGDVAIYQTCTYIDAFGHLFAYNFWLLGVSVSGVTNVACMVAIPYNNGWAVPWDEFVWCTTACNDKWDAVYVGDQQVKRLGGRKLVLKLWGFNLLWIIHVKGKGEIVLPRRGDSLRNPGTCCVVHQREAVVI